MQKHRKLSVAFLVVGALVALFALFNVPGSAGVSYISDNPKACLNCHLMEPHFQSWAQSSHHNVAVCNDCHTPGSFFQKTKSKVSNGMRHSWAYLTGHYSLPLTIRPANSALVEYSCRSCHKNFLEESKAPQHHSNLSCIGCHGNVGHK